MDWDDQSPISLNPCSCAGDNTDIADHEQDTTLNVDDPEDNVDSSKSHDSLELSCWNIPFIDPSDGFFRPELSILRSVRPERKIPARCTTRA